MEPDMVAASKSGVENHSSLQAMTNAAPEKVPLKVPFIIGEAFFVFYNDLDLLRMINRSLISGFE